VVPVQPVRQEVLDLQVQLEALEHQERQEAQVEQEALARLVLQELQVVPVHQVHRAGMVQVGVVVTAARTIFQVMVVQQVAGER
jgi:hypothetical protein